MNQSKYEILRETYKKNPISVLLADLSKVEKIILDYVSDKWKFPNLLWQEREAISDLIKEKKEYTKKNQEHYRIVKSQDSSLSVSQLREKLLGVEEELFEKIINPDLNDGDGLEFVFEKRRALQDLLRDKPFGEKRDYLKPMKLLLSSAITKRHKGLIRRLKEGIEILHKIIYNKVKEVKC